MHFAQTAIKIGATALSLAILTACGSGGSETPSPTPASSAAPNSSAASNNNDSSLPLSSAVALSSMSNTSSAGVSSSLAVSSIASSDMTSSSVTPVDCDADIALGKAAYAANTCFACHGGDADIPTDGPTSWSGGAGSIDLFDSQGDGYLAADKTTYAALDLPEYISLYMPNTDIPVSLEVANQITAYLTDKVGQPWCPGEEWPVSGETSSAPASSAAASSTPVSSTPVSSTPVSSTPVSSTPVSSTPVSSAPVSSTPVSSASVSSAPVSSAPVSSAPVSSTPVSSTPASSEMASSSAPALTATVEYVFPTQGAHLGGAASVKVALKVADTEAAGTVTAVSVNGMDLVLDGTMWKSSVSDLLAVDTSSNDQVFEVKVQLDNADWYDANSLMLNNLGGETVTQAGITSIDYARSVAINAEGTVFFSDVSKAKVYRVNAVTGVSDVIYEGTVSVDNVASLSWPIVVDGDKVYVLTDSYGYNADLNESAYTLKVVSIDLASNNSVIEFEDTNSEVRKMESALGLTLDKNGDFGPSDGDINVYSINRIGDSIIRWPLDGSRPKASKHDLTTGEGLVAIAQSPKTGHMFTIQEFSELNKRGAPRLIEYKTEFDEAFAEEVFRMSEFNQPTAMAIDAAGDFAYIADSGQIFKMSLVDYTYEVISSSRSDKPTVGTGISLSASVKGMTFNPQTGMLYLAADSDGVMMIDVTTGNRYGVVK